MNADPTSTYIQLLYYIVKPGIGILYDELLVFSFLRKQNFQLFDTCLTCLQSCLGRTEINYTET